ncbi:hypothetical protein [Kitasatospora sp. NPDC057595]|uniref:hypothetical protein n=1 Tax=Kitasatospora sp. NPDC057595 TaxID=3346177 RepID=UPI0036C09DDB
MTALHTVRLAPADGPAPSAGAPGTHFEARIHSPAGVCHGQLASRLPAGRSGGPLTRAFVDEHLALDLADPDAARWRHHADVLHLGAAAPGPARLRLAAVLRAHPGCAVATADGEDGTLLVLARTGGRLVLRPRPGSSGPPSAAQRLAVGSLAHTWLAAGRTLAEITTLTASAYTSHPACPGCPLAG